MQEEVGLSLASASSLQRQGTQVRAAMNVDLGGVSYLFSDKGMLNEGVLLPPICWDSLGSFYRLRCQVCLPPSATCDLDGFVSECSVTGIHTLHASWWTAVLNEDLGRVSYLFSDKTGTLTQNE